MNTRQISGTLFNLEGQPLKNASVSIELTPSTYTAAGLIQPSLKSYRTDAEGKLEAELFCNEEGDVASVYTLYGPGPDTWTFTVPSGSGTLTWSQLRALGVTENDPRYGTLASFVTQQIEERLEEYEPPQNEAPTFADLQGKPDVYPSRSEMARPLELPNDFGWTPPYSLWQRGGEFGVDLPQSYQPGGVIYYVSRTGVDSASGLTPDKPLQRLSVALNKPDIGELRILPGIYEKSRGLETVVISKNITLRRWGTGKVIISPHELAITWTAVAGTTGVYSGVRSQTSTVYDAKYPDIWGDYMPLTLRASVAEVDANPGSYFFDTATNTVYVKTLAPRAPDADIKVYCGLNNLRFTGNNLYVEGIEFEGGLSPVSLSGGSDQRAVFVDCRMKYGESAADGNGFHVRGTGLVIAKDCTAARNRIDGFNYHVLAESEVKALEINCIGRHNGVVGEGSANQGSTMHDDGTIIRLGGEYFQNTDQNIADVNTSKSFNAGVYAHDARGAGFANADFYVSTGMMWLVGCRSVGSLHSLVATSDGQLKTRDGVFPGAKIESGGIIEEF